MNRNTTCVILALCLSAWASIARGSGDVGQVPADGLVQFVPPQGVGCVAVRVDVPQDKMITGLRWYNGTSTTAFPRILVASGNDFMPPPYDQAVPVVEDARGVENGWSELTFAVPVASQSGTLFVLMEYPVNYSPAAGQTTLGVGYAKVGSPRHYFVTGDGESWIKVVSKCRVLLDPVLADLIPGVAEKHGPGGGSVPQPARGMGLFASPNPFNPKTTIDLYLPSATSGSVKIFDIRGYLVAELYSGPMHQGQNTFTWQGRDNGGKAVASGAYWVMAQTADQKLTRKLLLIK